MKKLLLMCLMLSSSIWLGVNSYATPHAQSLDQIVAIVNDDVVTKSELARAITAVKAQMTQDLVAIPSDSQLEKQVLDQLINKKLQLQAAKQSGIQIKDSDIDKAITRIAQQNNISIEVLYQHLNQEGMSKTTYRNELHDQLMLQKMQQQEVVGRLVVSPQEVTNFIHSRLWQENANSGKEYRLADILVPLSDNPSSNEISIAHKHAELILSKLEHGESFPEVAHSDTDHALQNGDLGWRKLPEIPSAFATKVVKMQPKQFAGPIQTPNGFHILLLTDMRKVNTVQTAPTRKQAEELLLEKKFEDGVKTWVSKLRGQAFIVTNPTK